MTRIAAATLLLLAASPLMGQVASQKPKRAVKKATPVPPAATPAPPPATPAPIPNIGEDFSKSALKLLVAINAGKDVDTAISELEVTMLPMPKDSTNMEETRQYITESRVHLSLAITLKLIARDKGISLACVSGVSSQLRSRHWTDLPAECGAGDNSAKSVPPTTRYGATVPPTLTPMPVPHQQ